MASNGLMPHRDGYPVSRDWQHIECRRKSCLFNNGENSCTVPSLCKIGEDGQCTGFSLRPVEIKKQ